MGLAVSASLFPRDHGRGRRMDASLTGLVYYLETVATRGQLLKFLELCGEEPEGYDDEKLRAAVEHYAQDDVYRGLAALVARRADRVPGALRQPFEAFEWRERHHLPTFKPTVLFDVATGDFRDVTEEDFAADIRFGSPAAAATGGGAAAAPGSEFSVAEMQGLRALL